MDIMHYDLWDIDSQARKNSEELWELIDKFVDGCNQHVSKLGFKINTNGD